MEEYKIEQPQAQTTPKVEKELKDEDITVYPKVRKGCNHCYGRGYEGWDTKGLPIICRCIINRIGSQDVVLMTWKELKEILNARIPYETTKLEDAAVKTIETFDKENSYQFAQRPEDTGKYNLVNQKVDLPKLSEEEEIA
jgi:hypothetical protein